MAFSPSQGESLPSPAFSDWIEMATINAPQASKIAGKLGVNNTPTPAPAATPQNMVQVVNRTNQALADFHKQHPLNANPHTSGQNRSTPAATR
jgi:hypothetical protein